MGACTSSPEKERAEKKPKSKKSARKYQTENDNGNANNKHHQPLVAATAAAEVARNGLSNSTNGHTDVTITVTDHDQSGAGVEATKGPMNGIHYNSCSHPVPEPEKKALLADEPVDDSRLESRESKSPPPSNNSPSSSPEEAHPPCNGRAEPKHHSAAFGSPISPLAPFRLPSEHSLFAETDLPDANVDLSSKDALVTDNCYSSPQVAVEVQSEEITVAAPSTFKALPIFSSDIHEDIINDTATVPVDIQQATASLKDTLSNSTDVHEIVASLKDTSTVPTEVQDMVASLKDAPTVPTEVQEVVASLKDAPTVPTETQEVVTSLVNKLAASTEVQKVVASASDIPIVPTEVQEVIASLKDSPTEVKNVIASLKDSPKEIQEVIASLKDSPKEIQEVIASLKDSPTEVKNVISSLKDITTEAQGGTSIEDIAMGSTEDLPDVYPIPLEVENILKPLDLGDEVYIKVMQTMHEDLLKGLDPDTHAKANIKCYPTYVRAVPDGSEFGDFLALDLGGTNFRVLLINLNKQTVTMESKIYIIPQHIMLGTGVQLFDHIADCIFKFMSDQQLLGRQLPLGFTFSFPCRQVGLDKAILTTWTKGFKCEGVEGNDIVQLLHEAINRRGDMTNVKCLAVINDTVGALMSCAHVDKQCAVGLILGTGTNACYIDRIEDVKTWDGDLDEPKQVLINSEWGAFGNDGNLDFVLTDFDRSIDKHSINPGRQIYEKMISGMYMGEIARLAIERLRKHNLLFEGEGSYHLSTRGRFYTKYVSEIEGDDVDSFTVTKQIFEEMELTSYTEQDCRLVRHVCSLVSRRAAYLASAGIACLLNKMNKLDVTVGVDGSLYRFHPFFHDLMMEKIRTLVHPTIEFKLMLSHDGSGKGAALVAAVAHRLLQDKSKDDGDLENGNASTSVD